MKYFVLLFSIILLASCNRISKEQAIVDKSIETHFNNGLEKVFISFTFRNRKYTVKRTKDEFTYTRTFNDSSDLVKDILVNSTDFTRLINGDTTPVSEEWSRKYTSSVNSVLYFMQLPYLLNDPAVEKKYAGEFTIEGEPYDGVAISFQKDGGGEDHDDQFLFWFHRQNKTMDFFSYSYTEDEGGVRFRKAINKKKVNGILFQDYINYEVPVGTPLETIPDLFESGKLKELSRIINENIKVRYL